MLVRVGGGGAGVVGGTGFGALGPRRVEVWRSAGSGSAGASVVVVVAGAAVVVVSAGTVVGGVVASTSTVTVLVGAARSSESEWTSALATRSEERRVGKECVSTCRSRVAAYH